MSIYFWLSVPVFWGDNSRFEMQQALVYIMRFALHGCNDISGTPLNLFTTNLFIVITEGEFDFITQRREDKHCWRK